MSGQRAGPRVCCTPKTPGRSSAGGTKREPAHLPICALEDAVACRGHHDFVFGGLVYAARHPLSHGLPLGLRFFLPRQVLLLDGEHLKYEGTGFVSRMRLCGSQTAGERAIRGLADVRRIAPW